MAKGKTSSAEMVSIPAMRIGEAEIALIGTTPLLMHAWSQKARQEMLNKQMQLPSSGREAKDPIEDFLRCIYRTDDGYYGFPAVAIKDAMVEACTSIAAMTKVAARQAFHIVGERGKTTGAFCDIFSPMDLVRIVTPEAPRMREDMVRVGMGTADLRYRPEFWPWGALIRLRYNKSVLSAEQIANTLNTAGFGVGIGEWRMEKNGQSGSFAVANEVETHRVRGWLKGKQPEPVLPNVSRWLASLAAPKLASVKSGRKRAANE